MLNRLQRWAARLPPPLRRAINSIKGVGWLRQRLSGRPSGPRPSSGQLRPVVYLPTWSRWDSMRQRPQYLLAAFAKLGHPVYFVDHHEKRPRESDGVQIVPDLATVPPSDVILYLHFAPLQVLLDRFERPAVVYDILDDLTIYEADEVHVPSERRVAAHHGAMLEAADVVLASSPLLMDTHRDEAPGIMLVENGVDAAMFSTPQPRPHDLPPADSDRPLVGYVGAISYWFDFELLTAVASALPGWTFALVGPVDPRAAEEAKRLSALPNVVLLGEKPSNQVPAYSQAVDVGTIWFRIDEMTSAVSPLKLYEYLAAGTPCVSTPLPVAEASPSTRTAATTEQFVEALRLAREEKGTAQFVNSAAAEVSTATWEVRLQPVLNRLEELKLARVT